MEGGNVSDLLKRIPSNATKRILFPIKGKVETGVEYKWVDENGITWRLRIHGPDASAPVGSNAANGWIYRVQKGGKYMDPNGVFHPKGITNEDSPNYDEKLSNETHIPINNDVGL